MATQCSHEEDYFFPLRLPSTESVAAAAQAGVLPHTLLHFLLIQSGEQFR